MNTLPVMQMPQTPLVKADHGQTQLLHYPRSKTQTDAPRDI